MCECRKSGDFQLFLALQVIKIWFIIQIITLHFFRQPCVLVESGEWSVECGVWRMESGE
jgi:hypothetical protein